MKITKFDKTPNTTLYTAPVTPPSTPSKPVICSILNKRPLSDTEKANMKRIWKNVVIYNFHDEIDDSQLLTAELNWTWTLINECRLLFCLIYNKEPNFSRTESIFQRTQDFTSPTDIASSGVWENVILSKTPTFDDVCGMLSFTLLVWICLPNVIVFTFFVVDTW